MPPTLVQTVVFALAPAGGRPEGGTPTGGNLGPVVFGGDGLTAEAMRGWAERLGAEAAFVLPPTRPDCALRLRYFVPRHEMEMCVHATVAAVTVLAERGELRGREARVETALGAVPVTWGRDPDGLAVAVEQFAPTFGVPLGPAGPHVAAALGALCLTRDALDLAAGPVQVASVSRSKLMVPVRDWAVLDALRPDWEALWTVTAGRYGRACAGGRRSKACREAVDRGRVRRGRGPGVGASCPRADAQARTRS